MRQHFLRLGFPVKVTGDASLKSHDARRWQNNPHLKVSLSYLDAIFDYLGRNRMDMYRMSSDLAPYVTHPDLPDFHDMIRDSDRDLAAVGAKARALDIRLSFHPSQFVVINSPDSDLVRKSTRDLSAQAEMLDRMEMGPEAVVVLHVGGIYGDHDAARRRWIEAWQTLPSHVRARLILEHDDLRFSAADILFIHEHTGVRLVFDHQHFWCLNPEQLAMRPTLERILRTWPPDTRPKVHFSSPRTELRSVSRTHPGSGKTRIAHLPPVATAHADFANPFEFANFMRLADDLTFDVMLESKAKDAAVLRLRTQLPRYAPDVASRFGIRDAIAPEEEMADMEMDAAG